MRSDLESNQAFDQHIKSGRFSHSRKVLGGDIALTTNGALVNFLDANGLTRIITLPALEDGRFYVVSNVGAANNLEVRSANGLLITTLLPRDSALLFASNAEWVALRGWAALGVFTNTVNGLVPAPNSGVPGSLFLRDDGQWAQVQVTGIVDAFKFITDGTTIAIGSGPDTFRLRSSTNKVGIVVQNNDATFGDNANFTVNEANVDHNSLLNYVADQHVAHSGVTLTAGIGLAGGGTIAASRTFDLDLNDLTTDVPVLADFFGFYDVSGLDTNKATLTTLNGILDHNALLNYVANRHIDHTGVSIIAGAGLAGGGDITTSRTLALDINGLAADTLAVGDFFAFYDISGVDHNKVTLANLNASLDHNSLLNYVANQHIDHTVVSITAGSGLTGGGTIAATRSLALDGADARNVDHSAVSIATTEGVQGGGTIAATRTLKLDINGLAQDVTPDPIADFYVTYDASAATHKKVKPTALHRELLTANRTYFVSATGSNSNNGLTSGTPFATEQKAMDVITATLDVAGFTVTVQSADGTYSGATHQLQIKNWIGGGVVVFQGNATTNTNVVRDCTGVAGTTIAYDASFGLLPGIVRIKDMKIMGYTVGIQTRAGGRVQYTNIAFQNVSFASAVATFQGLLEPYGNNSYTWTTGAQNYFYLTDVGGSISSVGSDLPAVIGTLTITGTPAWGVAFAKAQGHSRIVIGSTGVFSGASTGVRYDVVENSLIRVNAAGATYLPGGTAGTTSTGGQYV